ncbi:MAG: S41 family peptidase [Clostridium sp.]|nr:S41 family peptidase [Clostridium sp.]MCM1443686.1 S41 family peptidase [Candidatus Amulumruptor caecigallinarius]
MVKETREQKKTTKRPTTASNMKNKKKFQLFRPVEVIILMISVAVICFSTGYILCLRFSAWTMNTNIKTSALQEFYDTYKFIVDNYYGEIDQNKLIENAITGMLDSLDIHTTHITDDDSNNFNRLLEGSYEGLGVEITSNSDSDIVVVTVFENTPASKSGLKQNDIIKRINDVSVVGLSTNEVVKMISENKTMVLTIKRDNEELKITINKEHVELNSVTSKIIKEDNKKIGYIYISIFASNTYDQFKEQLEQLEVKGIDSLIIDVRGNTGGHLSVVTDMLSLFLDSKHVIYKTQDKSGIKEYFSTGKISKQYPIVVLVDGNSASASEILASALKEQYNAVLVGEKTYGKGTVQELITKEDGYQYKITTQHWLTSKGEWINEKGIEVDYNIDLTIKYYENPVEENDNQLKKAIEISRDLIK